MFCIKCGKGLPLEANFCAFCGAKLVEISDTAEAATSIPVVSDNVEAAITTVQPQVTEEEVVIDNSRDEQGDTALIRAARDGETEEVKSLIGKGVDVNMANNNGDTALIVAINSNDTEIARLLLEAGANPDARDVRGAIPLFLACQKQNKKMMKLLMAAGANYNAVLGGNNYSRFKDFICINRRNEEEQKRALKEIGIES